MTIQQAAKAALDCQNASNLSGVITTLAVIVATVLTPESLRLGKGSDWVNSHPIVILFVDKLHSLGRGADIGAAYDEVTRLAYPSGVMSV